MAQKAIIIGASSGIGREMALILAAQGWLVGISGRRKELLEEVQAIQPDRIRCASFDAADLDRLDENLQELVEQLGGLDLFVISAGTGSLNPALDPAPELATVDTNVRAFTALCDWAYARFLTSGGGSLAAITSVGGMIGEAEAPAYAASKAYQILYLEGLRMAAKKRNPGLSVIEIRPGSVDTRMMQGEGHFWISQPVDAARLACEAIEKKAALQYVSKRWALIGLLLRLRSLFR